MSQVLSQAGGFSHFGPVKLNTRSRFIFDHSTHLESGFSKAVGEAWDILPDTVRQLMLFAWAAVQNVRIERNDSEVAHPNMTGSTVEDILNSDLHNTFDNLHAAACDIAVYLFISWSDCRVCAIYHIFIFWLYSDMFPLYIRLR